MKICVNIQFFAAAIEEECKKAYNMLDSGNVPLTAKMIKGW